MCNCIVNGKYSENKNILRRQKNQQDATIRCLLFISVSTCFGHHYAHLQEIKGPVTAFGVLFWFCWMWLVAVVGRCVVGCEHCSHPTTQRPHNRYQPHPVDAGIIIIIFLILAYPVYKI